MANRSVARLRLYARSLFAVLAGFAAIVILSTATDELLHGRGVLPRGAMWNPWHNLLALGYRSLFAVAGGFGTAWLAPRAPLRHASILGFIGVAGGVAGVILSWKLGLGPHWYPVALAVTAFPLVWLGGWLYARRPIA